VRIALGRLGVEPDLDEGRFDEPPALVGARREAVHLEPLLDDLRDRKAGRQARERILKDDLDLATQWPQLALAERGDVALREADLPLRLGQPQQGKPQCRLARAALADDAEGRPAPHRE